MTKNPAISANKWLFNDSALRWSKKGRGKVWGAARGGGVWFTKTHSVPRYKLGRFLLKLGCFVLNLATQLTDAALAWTLYVLKKNCDQNIESIDLITLVSILRLIHPPLLCTECVLSPVWPIKRCFCSNKSKLMQKTSKEKFGLFLQVVMSSSLCKEC